MPAADVGVKPVPRPVDPRSVITEDALTVSPQLLGLPLAGPWRRAAAMAVDGILVAILAAAPSILFWDRNRQGIHDKIAETAVILEHGSRAPPAGWNAAASPSTPGTDWTRS